MFKSLLFAVCADRKVKSATRTSYVGSISALVQREGGLPRRNAQLPGCL